MKTFAYSSNHSFNCCLRSNVKDSVANGSVGTIATAPSASSAASANVWAHCIGYCAINVDKHSIVLLQFSDVVKIFVHFGRCFFGSSPISSSHASASSLGSSSGNFAANLDASIFCEGTLLRSSEVVPLLSNWCEQRNLFSMSHSVGGIASRHHGRHHC